MRTTLAHRAACGTGIYCLSFPVRFITFLLEPSLHICAVTATCTLCAAKQKHLKCSESQSGCDVSVQLASWFYSFVISLYLSVCGFCLPSTNCSYLCRTSVEQRHQYVCLIWVKHELMLITFQSPPEARQDVRALLRLVAWLPAFRR
jgi:hypothetical protein